MLIATYACAALVCGGSLVVGRAILGALGRREVTWLEPAVGLGALLTVSSLGIRAPHRATTTLILLIVLVVLSVGYLRRRALPGTKAKLAAPVALLTGLGASLPFIASGHIGPLGIGLNNDLAGHMHYVAWLEDPVVRIPSTVAHGYPIGPHGLAAALANGTGAEPLAGLLGLLIAIPVLTAITSLAVLGDLRPLPRAIAAALTALTYLAAASLSIGLFKETIMALLLLGFALGLRELTQGEGNRRGLLIALGVLMAGMLAVYSYPGILYAVAVGGTWAAAEVVSARRRGEQQQLIAAVRRAAPMAAIPLLVVLVLGVAELPRIIDFINSGAVSFVQGVNSRLKEAVSPFEALGFWPASRFLNGSAGLAHHYAFAAIGLVAIAVGVRDAFRRRERALLGGLAGALLIYLGALVDGGFYVQAKALYIGAPLAALLIFRALFGRASTPPRSAPRAALTVAFVAIAGYSSFLVLREARVAPPQFASGQLAKFRPLLRGKTVLSLTSDRFTDYYLRGAYVESPARYAEELAPPNPLKFMHLPIDFDSVASGALDRYDYAVAPRSAYQSAPPSNYKQVAETPDFILYKRVGPSPRIGTLDELERPGELYDCRDRGLRNLVDGALKQGFTTARVEPVPVVGRRHFWLPHSRVGDGQQTSQKLQLPPGRWQLSLQYYSPVLSLTVQAGGLRVHLPPTADGGVRYRTEQGPFWGLGPIDSTGGSVRVTVRASGLSRLGKLLRVDQKAEIGNVTAAQPDKARQVPLRAACGLYIDHFTVGPG